MPTSNVLKQLRRLNWTSSLLLALLLLVSGSVLAQKNVQLRGVLDYENTLNDIWGYVDGGGNEYALVGLQIGVSIVDISDPANPTELFFVPGDTSIWRDLKTWDQHAYITNENAGGLQIIDLSNLPSSISFDNWTGGTLNFQKAHNIYIDEQGVGYLFGANLFNRGAIMLDLTADPMNPTVLGIYDDFYCHDGMARGDTLYTAEIYAGQFSVVDISDKSNPVVLQRQKTGSEFAHNIWVSDNSKYVYTTDELKNASVEAYDISDLFNIKMLDSYQSSPGDSVIPHNTHVYSKHLVTSYYRDGVTIVDASRPHNLVEVGYYDTSPLSSAPGFEGCWGVYPYLPSGLIIASDRQEGLFVLEPNYVEACYLEGTVSNAGSGFPEANVKVAIVGQDWVERSSLTGEYAIGAADSGLYDVRFYRSGCATKIISGVLLEPGQVTTLDVDLNCAGTTSISEVAEDGASLWYDYKGSASLYVLNPKAETAMLSIYNMNGQLLKTYSLQQGEFEISLCQYLAAGSYMLHLQQNKQQKTLLIQLL